MIDERALAIGTQLHIDVARKVLGCSAVADEVLDDLWRRLDATRWPDDGPGGFALSDARELAAYWRDGYDWRAAEDELLGFSNVDVDGLHAIVEGDGPPLLLLHGWPRRCGSSTA